MVPMLLAALAAATGGFQSTTALDTLVEQFAGRPIGEEGGAQTPVDTRLKLAACPAPQLAWRTEAHDAVVVTCMAPRWRVFVPMRMVPKPVAAPTAAAAVAAPAPRPQPVIRRGDPVTVEAGAPGFSITRDGVAMGDAAPGARLLVKIGDARQPIQAVAIEPGRATLPGWND